MDADGLLLAKSDLPFVQRPYDTHFLFLFLLSLLIPILCHTGKQSMVSLTVVALHVACRETSCLLCIIILLM